MYSIPSALGRLAEQLEDLRGEGRAAADHRARPERMAAELLLLHAGGVGGVGDVDRERQVRARPRRRSVRAPLRPISSWTEAIAAIRPRELAALVAAPQRPRARRRRRGGCPSTARRAGRRRAVSGSAAITTGSPMRTSSSAPVAIGGADVDVQAVELDRLLSLLLLEQVDRLAPDDAGHRAVPRLDPDPLADQDLRVPAADRGEVEEALLVDVGDRRARSRRCGRRRRAAARHPPRRSPRSRTRCRRCSSSRERGRLAPERSGRGLIARWRRRREQALEQLGGLARRRWRSRSRAYPIQSSRRRPPRWGAARCGRGRERAAASRPPRTSASPSAASSSPS